MLSELLVSRLISGADVSPALTVVEGKVVRFHCREIDSRPGGPNCVDRLREMRGKYSVYVGSERSQTSCAAERYIGEGREGKSRNRRERLKKKEPATVVGEGRPNRFQALLEDRQDLHRRHGWARSVSSLGELHCQYGVIIERQSQPNSTLDESCESQLKS